jgi:flagellar assembly protein FliH
LSALQQENTKTQGQKFVFGQDFRDPVKVDTRHQEALEEAEKRGFQAGLMEGRRQGEAAIHAHIRTIIEQIGGFLAQSQARQVYLEQEAVQLALTLGRKLAGNALAHSPLSSIQEAVHQAFQHMLAVPHLAVHVHESLVEDVQKLIEPIARARGFEGRLVILGAPDTAPGTVRLEWADGGVVLDTSRMDDIIAQFISQLKP